MPPAPTEPACDVFPAMRSPASPRSLPTPRAPRSCRASAAGGRRRPRQDPARSTWSPRRTRRRSAPSPPPWRAVSRLRGRRRGGHRGRPSLLGRLAGAPLAFVVDPVDGTANFAAGLPLFGVMAAAIVRGEIVAAVIHDPVGDDTAWRCAARARGCRDAAAGGATCAWPRPGPWRR